MTASSPAALEVRGIAKNFGGLSVLRDVSFAVDPGEIIGLMGPNGAGKSTLFEIIGGGLRPAAGQVHFFGTDITARPPHLRRRDGLSRTFQKIRLFDSLTVHENVLVSASESSVLQTNAGRSSASAHAAVDEVLQLVELDTKQARRPPELTLGDRKRLEIARAIAGRCRVLLLDESLSGLTHDEADGLIAVIQRLNRERGITVVLVEHVMPIVMALAQRLVVLHYGRVIASGVPQQIVQDPVVIEAYLGKQGKA